MRILFQLAYTCVLVGLLLYDMLGLEVCDRARWIMLLEIKLLVKLMSMWAIEEPVIIILFIYLGSTVIDEPIAYRWGGTCGTCKAALFFEVFSLSRATRWWNSEVYWYALYYVLSRGHDDSLVVLDIKLRLVDGFEHDDLGCLRWTSV